ncbi:putative AC transposase [Bienertia sinuspersici]
MEDAHNGFNNKIRIVNCCKNFHLVDKIFSISLDNATTNTKAMEFLKEDPNINMLLNDSLMHVRCCTHILNLCVQEGLDTPTRLNSTYKLLHNAIVNRDILTHMYNESRTNGRFITNDHWSLAKIMHDVLETFDNATHIFSYLYEPNIHMVILECIKIIYSIKQTSQANPGPSFKNVLDNMKEKWYAYYTEFPPIYGIAAILDPGVKIQGITYDVAYYVNKCKIILERLCEDYGVVIQPDSVGSSKGKSRSGFLRPILEK